jgi:hypothetical protein
MASVVDSIITLFAVLIILLWSFTMDIGNSEKQIGYTFLYAPLNSAILATIFLYISNRMEKHKR